MTRRKLVNRPQHPVAPPSGLVLLSRVVLYDNIGAGPHPCHWCGRSLRWKHGPVGKDAIMADHLDGDVTNDAESNLVASCQSCNAHRARGVTDSEPHRVSPKGHRVRGKDAVCDYCGKNFVAIPGTQGKFCSPSCRGQGVGAMLRARSTETAICEFCRASFPRKKKRPEGTGRFCSRGCAGAYRSSSQVSSS